MLNTIHCLHFQNYRKGKSLPCISPEKNIGALIFTFSPKLSLSLKGTPS